MEANVYKAPHLQPLLAAPPPSTSHRQGHGISTILCQVVLAALTLLSLYGSLHISCSMHSAEPDLSPYTESIFLPFIYKFSPKHVPQVWCTIEGVSIEMPVDTGSTGILIGAPLLPTVDPTIGEPAHHFFTSSRILYVGRLVKLSVRFQGESNAYATTTVPVLVVDKSWLCPWYQPDRDGFNCPPGPNGEKAVDRNTSQITYMGVGFGRNCPRDGMPIAAPQVNAFLNIDTINGRPMSSKTLRAGYVVSTAGIGIGLTPDNIRGFKMESLDPGCTHEKDARDWAMAKTCFSINGGKKSCGSVLIDTGIAQMYIRAEEGVLIPTITLPNPNPHGRAKMVKRVKPGTNITVGFPTLKHAATFYSFVVGDGASVEPTYVVPERATAPAFVNTGRNFLFGYSIVFDAVAGRFGIRPVQDSPSPSL